jgi:hypothetical protein
MMMKKIPPKKQRTREIIKSFFLFVIRLIFCILLNHFQRSETGNNQQNKALPANGVYVYKKLIIFCEMDFLI